MNRPDVAASRLFERDADSYDALRRALIPCFDAFYGNALDVIHRWCAGGAIRVLDLGAGTGLFSGMVRDRLRPVDLHLVDASSAMLDQARRRLGSDGVTVHVDDIGAADLGGPWDLVISALAIHHVDDKAKQGLFARIWSSLAPGGLFVNAEQVLGPTPTIEAEYAARWHHDVRAAGVSDTEIAKAVERMGHDRCATVEHQLQWMRQAGLVHVDCSFKAWRFAVLSGRRPA